MDNKKAQKTNILGLIGKNILLAGVILVIAVVATVIGLRSYTEHGVEVEVPNVKGLFASEAVVELEDLGLHMVIIDSTYSTKTPLGTIVEQNPEPGTHVKHDREIYVIENARFRRPVIMPELRDMSLRQAQTTLKGMGLEVKKILFEPSTYKNIILDVRCDSLPVEPGSRLMEGTALTLIVGVGPGTKETCVPALLGKNLTQARSWLLNAMLSVGSVTYDVPPTEETVRDYVVYYQFPEAGYNVIEGTAVHLKLTTDIEKSVTSYSENDDDTFF